MILGIGTDLASIDRIERTLALIIWLIAGPRKR